MADIGIVGAAPGTLITERPIEEVERRVSLAISQNERRQSSAASVADGGERRPSIIQQTLSKISPSAEKLDFRRKGSIVTAHDLETIRETKQLEGEAFASGGQARYYEPIDSYEGKHRWDPKAEWSDHEEKLVVRKLDLRICSWVCFMFFALQLDRGNIAQALTDNLLRKSSCYLPSRCDPMRLGTDL